ncbi:PTS system mannose/fructose/N-acetylgalactosamine-transporter subunit IIB [Thermoanaerobacterium sp. DL9XJH110]|uniref:PTS system mannose/fructose/N-acetylgalactosamine-transporter subunit IIB n=1 Tax=Thermoanaerobacterium sp. DL9XJH110 TaxID=3386643 RepID=UPI003BB51E3A
MVDIRLVRIDDRLIHGQITSAWISDLGVDTIVVADDRTVKDDLQKMMLKMATPPNMNLKIFGVEEAASYLKDPGNSGRALVLVKGAMQALTLIEKGIAVKYVNVGNLSMDPKKKNIYKSIWVGEDDIAHFKKINSLGIELEVRVVPNDRPIPLFSLIK